MPVPCVLWSRAGLFRTGTGTKTLADFLARDFRDASHRQAACKNAFVLLGQHRHELAAAFFILGTVESPCSNTLGVPTLQDCYMELKRTLQQPLLLWTRCPLELHPGHICNWCFAVKGCTDA